MIIDELDMPMEEASSHPDFQEIGRSTSYKEKMKLQQGFD